MRLGADGNTAVLSEPCRCVVRGENKESSDTYNTTSGQRCYDAGARHSVCPFRVSVEYMYSTVNQSDVAYRRCPSRVAALIVVLVQQQSLVCVSS